MIGAFFFLLREVQEDS